MKIQYASDLHLEFESNYRWLQFQPLKVVGEVLILAGDTTYIRDDYWRDPFFDQLSRDFEQVYMIPGNHEYYSGWDVLQAYPSLHKKIRDNVHLVNNQVIKTDHADLIFTTLWTKIIKNPFPIVKGLADFRYIRYGDEKLKLENYNALFEESFQFLKGLLKPSKTKKRVVITHHLPSLRCNVDEFAGSVLNEAFCVDLTAFINESKPDIWIYGHSHRNKEPFYIGETLLLTNQMGYVDHNEEKTFKREAVFEI